jgi:hypothetical protein
MEKINWEKYRIRRCKSRYICKICGNLISKGEKYYNTGMKQAHTSCVEFLDYDDSDIDSKSNLEQEELFKKNFKPSTKSCYNGPRGFVHVFESGSYTCNYGERTCQPMEGKYVGNSFLYGNMK